jgi:hypothetical protein
MDLDVSTPVLSVQGSSNKCKIPKQLSRKSTNKFALSKPKPVTNKSKSMLISKIHGIKTLTALPSKDKAKDTAKSNDKLPLNKDYQFYVARHYARIEIGSWVSKIIKSEFNFYFRGRVKRKIYKVTSVVLAVAKKSDLSTNPGIQVSPASKPKK